MTAVDMNELVAMVNSGRYAELEKKASELLSKEPASGFVWKVLGVCLWTQGKHAQRALEEAAKLLPNDAEAHNNLGNALLENGRLHEAVQSCRRALEINPYLVEAHSNLGNALRGLGRFTEAIASYRQALDIQPGFAIVHNNMGNALRGLGRLDEAIASYRQALQLAPRFVEGLINLGNALRSIGRGDEAVACFRQALAIKPDFAAAHNNLGNALRDQGQLKEAVESYRSALAAEPEHAEVHANLGDVLLNLGHVDEAIACYRRALEIIPEYAAAHAKLGNALRHLWRAEEAAASCRRALEIKPDYAEAHNTLGSVSLDCGYLVDAEASFQRAVELKPDYAEAHSNLAFVIRLCSRAAEAEASCRKALDLNPRLTAAIALLADIHADKGEFAEAEALLKRACANEPGSAPVWAALARFRKMTDNDAAWLAEAQRIAAQVLPPRQEVCLRYALGKYFDDVRDFDKAFGNYQRANELTRAHSKHDRSALENTFDRVIDLYDRTWISRHRGNANASSRPVFIVGLQRTGTTLAEQILASHPAVFGAGALIFWRPAASAYEMAVASGGESEALLAPLAQDYLRLLEQHSGAALRVVDKRNSNFMCLGLMHATFPNARIIHLTRNPIDVCLSNYFHEFNLAHAYSNDLSDMAHYYSLYARLMEHWRATLPSGAILDVPYEGLVDDLEAWARKMLGFIGLPWDPHCLDFHRTQRTVITASKWQVRQKLTRSSVERWRNYAKFIGPLQSLDPP